MATTFASLDLTDGGFTNAKATGQCSACFASRKGVSDFDNVLIGKFSFGVALATTMLAAF